MIEVKDAEKYIEFRSMPAGQTLGTGWVLVAMYEEDETHHTGQTSYWDQQKNCNVYPLPTVLRKAHALYGRTRDAVLEESQMRTAQAQSDYQVAKGEKAEAVKDLDKVKTELAAEKARTTSLQASLEKLDKESTKRFTAVTLLEVDLGKVREAIGGDRFKEILGRSK